MTLRYDTRSRVSTYTQSWLGGEPDFGAYESIGTITVGSGGLSAVGFSGIPQTYKHLQLRIMDRNPSGEYISLRMTFNGDSSAVYTSHEVYGTGAAAGGTATIGLAYLTPFLNAPASATGIFGVGVCDILDYTNTNKFKTIRSLTGYDANGSGYIELASGVWRDTTAISSFTIVPSAGTMGQYSQFALYGIKA